MTEFGIFDIEADGFIFTQMTEAEAANEVTRAIAAGEYDEGDLKVEEMCPDHDEQAHRTCEECAADEAECPDHEGEPADDCQQCALEDAA